MGVFGTRLKMTAKSTIPNLSVLAPFVWMWSEVVWWYFGLLSSFWTHILKGHLWKWCKNMCIASACWELELLLCHNVLDLIGAQSVWCGSMCCPCVSKFIAMVVEESVVLLLWLFKCSVGLDFPDVMYDSKVDVQPTASKTFVVSSGPGGTMGISQDNWVAVWVYGDRLCLLWMLTDHEYGKMLCNSSMLLVPWGYLSPHNLFHLFGFLDSTVACSRVRCVTV